MSSLAFYIDAPLQSWGASSKFQLRETQNFPTKSAIVGLLAAAMGIDKYSPQEPAQLAPIASLHLTVVKLPKPVATTRLTDFHTIGGGYDRKASTREKMSIPQKASGAPFGTVITRRSYLTDAAFAAILSGDSEVLVELHQALLDPIWGVWFGRKSCIPATPLTPTLGDDEAQAFNALLNTIPGISPGPLDHFEFQQEVETSQPGDGTFYPNDQPIAFGAHHGPVPTAYPARPVRHHRPTP
ncbi:CRISPR system Cascade subunit CasD [Haloferula luteola]|uniref:CRISPR system Cascade subunit CasD n=1 Tax=Haloferula luteola TaxID=595692 RepID=A0A840V5P9_9BACT|nr:type I-E CRISPR-associated protein Cas5/CasD [Haloferula luteola]MBB5350954.1 CRISPR system Cascade subunit CasD [Haloferula luteola]